MKGLLIIGICTLFLVSGCCQEYAEEEVCITYGYETIPNGCINKILFYLPKGYDGTLDVTIDADDLCYDVLEDPENIRAYVDRIFEEHPEDWPDYLRSHKLDPQMILIEDENITEPKRVDVFNGTKIQKICLESAPEWVCVR